MMSKHVGLFGFGLMHMEWINFNRYPSGFESIQLWVLLSCLVRMMAWVFVVGYAFVS
jgi:hypothetical protein